MPTKTLPETPSQTAGPYLHLGMLPAPRNIAVQKMAQPKARGERIRVEGVVLDGAGDPVVDAVLEFWQADADGNYPHMNGERIAEFDPNLHAFGRTQTDAQSGEWWIETIRPGPVPGATGELQAPHITIFMFARGITTHLHTRMYFADQVDANAADPVLRALPNAAMRKSLIATADEPGKTTVYRFAIHLQGELETVFFDA